MYGGLYVGGHCPRPCIIDQQEEVVAVVAVERPLDLAPSPEPALASTAEGGRRLRCPLPRSGLSMLLLAPGMVSCAAFASDL